MPFARRCRRVSTRAVRVSRPRRPICFASKSCRSSVAAIFMFLSRFCSQFFPISLSLSIHPLLPRVTHNTDSGSAAEAGATTPDSSSSSREQETSSTGDDTNTYSVSLESVPSGNHQLVIYAHNPVGWSTVLRPPGVRVHVVNRAPIGVQASLVILALSLLSSLLLSDSTSDA